MLGRKSELFCQFHLLNMKSVYREGAKEKEKERDLRSSLSIYGSCHKNDVFYTIDWINVSIYELNELKPTMNNNCIVNDVLWTTTTMMTDTIQCD